MQKRNEMNKPSTRSKAKSGTKQNEETQSNHSADSDVEKAEKDGSPPPPYDEKPKDDFDPWALTAPKDTGKPWKEMSVFEKTLRVALNIGKGIAVLVLLYFFIISIDLLGSSFQLLAGRTAGNAFTNSELLNNPVCCMMIGVGVTVLLQSSSTSTSIVVTMVAAQIIPVQNGIYIIMGANIGTSVTNTIVALGQVADRNEFRRAFAGATVHDMFNWLAVLILLPVEVATSYLYYLTKAIVDTMDINTDVDEPQFLEVITEPLTSAIIQVDKDVIYAIAEGKFVAKRPLCDYLCEEEPYTITEYFPLGVDVEDTDYYKSVRDSKEYPEYWANNEKVEVVPYNFTNGTTGEAQLFSYDLPSFNESSYTESCKYWFVGAGLPDAYDGPEGWPTLNLTDAGVGGILLVLSLLLLCSCLLGMVKILNSLLQGPALKIVHSVLNSEMQCGEKAPKACNVFMREIAGYLSMLVGTGLTILVQSSSVFTSALTPLVGMGLITVERMYPLTLGANIGTTVTSILAAFTSEPETIQDALQVALAHLFFNITAILIFYPIPFMRAIPPFLAKKLGNITANYRWFAIAYLIIVFFVFPFLVFALSIPGWYVLASVLIPVALLVIFLIIVNAIRSRCPHRLPKRLQSWDWCPSFLCSLEPYDRLFKMCCKCCKICQEDFNKDPVPTNKVGVEDGDEISLKVVGDKFEEANENGVISKSYANNAYDADKPLETKRENSKL